MNGRKQQYLLGPALPMGRVAASPPANSAGTAVLAVEHGSMAISASTAVPHRLAAPQRRLPSVGRGVLSHLLQASMLAVLAWFCCLVLGSAAPAAAPAPDTAAAKTNVAETPESAEATQHNFIPTAHIGRIVDDAGPLMYAILLCSFLLVAFFLDRCVNLRRRRVIPKPFVTRFLQQLREGQLDRQAALELCEENRSPVANVFAGAVRKWGRPGVEVEQGVIDAGERATNGLRRHLRVFYGIATVGPLLGLMGTVLGMIQTFNVIADPAADAVGRTAPLAGGIAKALLNTAGGLAVAIPASILYVFFVSRVDQLVIEIDRLAQEVVNVISAEDLQEKRTPTPKSRRAVTTAAA
ncbi:MAG: MotA/TolQ/ExbB proton channel family protein [Planctomycetaceae bacterium]|nr:MotA/TolQ/ExbB proton channel family protein [Planctomycetaceae bacterium]